MCIHNSRQYFYRSSLFFELSEIGVVATVETQAGDLPIKFSLYLLTPTWCT